MLKTKIIFSVVIPVHKRYLLSLGAIKSVLTQVKGVNEMEIIICDDEKDAIKSKENKKKYLKLSKCVRYFRNKHKEGPGGNRQTGLEKAKGKYLLFLDSDDSLKSGFFEVMSRQLKSENTVATFCKSQIVYKEGFDPKIKHRLAILNLVKSFILWIAKLFNRGYLYPGSFYLCQISHMLFKRSKLKDFKFNYDYRHGGEDWDLFVYALQKGSIKIVDRSLVIFNYSQASSTPQLVNRINKWKSYSLLARRLPAKFKTSIFYGLFLMYINLFRKSDEK